MEWFIQLLSETAVASILWQTPVWRELLIDGLIQGLLPGLVAGALVMPMLRAGDSIGRGLLVGLIVSFGVALFSVIRIGTVTGQGMAEIFDSFMVNSAVGAMVLQSLYYLIFGFLGGMVIGIATVVPDQVIKGGLLGLFLGAFTGGALAVLFFYIGFPLAPGSGWFWVATGFVAGGLMMSVVGSDAGPRSAQKSVKKR